MKELIKKDNRTVIGLKLKRNPLAYQIFSLNEF